MDKRSPWTGGNQVNINPEDAKDLGINDGDYVYVDANAAERPYVGWKPEDEMYKVSRLLLRVKYNPVYPPGRPPGLADIRRPMRIRRSGGGLSTRGVPQGMAGGRISGQR